jgi:hypothetical protein
LFYFNNFYYFKKLKLKLTKLLFLVKLDFKKKKIFKSLYRIKPYLFLTNIEKNTQFGSCFLFTYDCIKTYFKINTSLSKLKRSKNLSKKKLLPLHNKFFTHLKKKKLNYFAKFKINLNQISYKTITSKFNKKYLFKFFLINFYKKNLIFEKKIIFKNNFFASSNQFFFNK